LIGSPQAVSAPPPSSVRAAMSATSCRRMSISSRYEHPDVGARRAADTARLTSL
jgi:hypothetical protein